jgi:hypothetical protein
MPAVAIRRVSVAGRCSLFFFSFFLRLIKKSCSLLVTLLNFFTNDLSYIISLHICPTGSLLLLGDKPTALVSGAGR